MDSSEHAHLDACQAGDISHFDALYTAHIDSVYRFLYRRTLVKEVAEDLTSITFMKALESIRSFNPSKGEFRSWLYRIARNALIDHYRSPARKTVSIENVWDLSSNDFPQDDASRSLESAKLHQALQSLKPLQREVLMLRLWEGLSYKEISRITKKSEGSLKVLVSRAVSDLRTQMPAFLLFLLFPRFL
jgi:RNA polymerase sigma-70 factor (ECF subfamily)